MVDNRETQKHRCCNWQQHYVGGKKDETHTAGLAPSVKKISSGLAGKPSRASMPAAIASLNPLIPWRELVRLWH